MTTAYQNLKLEIDGAVACVRLNRPDAFNAMNQPMLLELADALERIAADSSVRTMVMTGEGRAFCAGADLRATRDNMPRSEDGLPDLGAFLDRHYNPLILRLQSMPQAVIIAVNGVAAGGGASLALAADLTIAARSASFAQVFVNMNLVPDLGGTWVLPRHIGRQRAMGAFLLGQNIKAEQALASGLIFEVTDDEALMPRAMAIAQQIAAAPNLAVRSIKRAVHAAAGNTLAEQLDLERDLQRECGRSADFAEAVSAFVEKRKPQFNR